MQDEVFGNKFITSQQKNYNASDVVDINIPCEK